MIIILTFIAFTGLVALISWYKTKEENLSTKEGYFLAGRGLTGLVIAGSLEMTNLSTEQLVGQAGQSYSTNMGAEEVNIVYRRSEKELPARLEEIHHAKEEGVVFKFLTAPLEVLSDENFNVTGLKCQQMELGEPDASGRRRPIPVEGSEFVLDLDCVIAAIGTSPNPLIRHTTPGLETNRKGCIVADDEHGITSKDGVFAGGDAVTGAATVILAMGAGKRAAAAMDEYIKNKNK